MKRTIILIWMLPAAFLISFFTIGELGRAQSAQSGSAALAPTPSPTGTPSGLKLPGKVPQRFASLESNTPVRGVAGDLWADVVIGQPGFKQITPNQVVANKVFNPGGVLVDRNVIPNRLYVYDAGNSRILGFTSLGACAAGVNAGKSCTSTSDCPGSACTINATKPADIILGQPAPNESACNGDGSFQNYPVFPAPSAKSLCGLTPSAVSILEAGSVVTMAVDAQGNLYHPDFFNNRVLRYNTPFTSDQAADFVWGQPDFTHRDCSTPDNKSLCLRGQGWGRSGVAIDANGSLWVTDTNNHRVLRFPYDLSRNAPALTADLVLGQQGFTTGQGGTGLNEMLFPSSVRVGADGIVYVLDGDDGSGVRARLLLFSPPFSNGMQASQVFTDMGRYPTGLELDSSGDLWINNSENNNILRLSAGQLTQVIPWVDSGSWGGIGIDRDKAVMTGGWVNQQIFIYRPPSYPYWSDTFLKADFYSAYNELGAQGLANAQGLEVTDEQLIVSDGARILFWNDPLQLVSNYPPADGVIGQPDFHSRPSGIVFGRMRDDTEHNKLWVVRGNGAAHILAYPLPLATLAEPVIDITSPLPIKGGGSFAWTNSLHLGGIAYQPECDCLWLSDTNYNRVFRIRHINSADREVDIVLGQSSADGIHCNQGRDSDDGYAHGQFPSQDSLCHPGGLAFDRRGNLFVADHNLEIAGNWRMLEFDAVSLPPDPTTALFGLPASRVYGRNGSFTDPNCHTADGDPICAPWEPVFSLNNDMIVGFNGYVGTNFPVVYHDPLANPLPYASLMDFYSHAYSARRDSLGNLYMLDLTRSRVLIYKETTRTVSGNVGVSNATITYTNERVKTTTSAADGSYSFIVPDHWSGTVTPSHAYYSFTPSGRSYSNVDMDQVHQDYAPAILPAAGPVPASVTIGGLPSWNHEIEPSSELRVSYPGANSGPGRVVSTNDTPMLTSERVLYDGVSYSEMMGLPKEQLAKEYVFPYYNNVAMDSQLRVSNVGGVSTTIKVYIGSNKIDEYILAAGGATRRNYPYNGGPLRVSSSASNILTTIRVLYAGTSYSELMGFPVDRLTKEYLFPYYNNTAMDSQLRVSNVGTADTTIKIYLGTQQIDSYPLKAGQATRKNYPYNSGPLRVTSSVSNILTTVRVLYANSSYSELMGFPASQLAKEYWYPVYDNATVDSQLRVSNVGANSTTITVYAGTRQIDSYTLAAGAATRKNYPQNTGPLQVVSSNQPILTTIRMLYTTATFSSLYEMTGLPTTQLSTQYFFPWYNNAAMSSELRFAVP
jgi:hypothetical protein